MTHYNKCTTIQIKAIRARTIHISQLPWPSHTISFQFCKKWLGGGHKFLKPISECCKANQSNWRFIQHSTENCSNNIALQLVYLIMSYTSSTLISKSNLNLTPVIVWMYNKVIIPKTIRLLFTHGWKLEKGRKVTIWSLEMTELKRVAFMTALSMDTDEKQVP